MTTTLDPEAVAVPQLHHGDIVHIQPHDVYRDSDHPWRIDCQNADVQVDWVLYPGHVIVLVIWHDPDCPAVCGSTAYDAGDSVLRVAVAA